MQESRHFGLVGGLGVGATVLYYQAIAAACAKRQTVPRLTVAHAHAPTALAHVEADRIEALATYLGGFVRELAAAGADPTGQRAGRGGAARGRQPDPSRPDGQFDAKSNLVAVPERGRVTRGGDPGKSPVNRRPRVRGQGAHHCA